MRKAGLGLSALALAACGSLPSVSLPSIGGGSDAAKTDPALRLRPSDLTGLGGKDWAGALTYLDYGSGEKVSLDVTANVTVKLNCLGVAISYTDEPEANSKEEICISEDGSEFGGAKLVSLQRLGPDFIALQTEGKGEDDNKPALIRQNYILSTTALTSGKEVSFDDGETWIERNELDVER